MPVGPLAVPATGGLPVLAPAKALQIAKRPVHHENDVGTAAAIATIRPAARNVSLAPKRHGAVAAAAGLNEYAGAVLKHDRTLGLVANSY